ncbi:phage tail protein [Streptomyces prasinus]|uniref:phage tail protein n=1 Tax=Streptomyces prasinus TaxID=67345 RepID=UPI0033BD0F3B
MPQGQVIGRVSVRVLPDTSNFRRQAEKQLDRIEKQIKPVAIHTRLDMTGFTRDMIKQIREINRVNRTTDARKIRFKTMISVDGMNQEIKRAVRALQARADSADKVEFRGGINAADVDLKISDQSLRDMTEQLKDWRDDNSPLKIKIEPDMSAIAGAATSARLAALTRPRTVSIIPMLNDAAVAKVAAGLAALSGLRVVDNLFEKFSRTIKNLDKNVPIIGTLATAIAGLAGWALSAASNLFALSASLAQIGAVSLTLPGILGGFAVGIGVTIAALKDFNTVLPEVKTQLSELQDQISSNFWAEAKAPIQELVDVLMPRFATGFQQTATAAGTFFASFSTQLTEALNADLVDEMFGYLNESITEATKGTDTFASIIAQLGEVGTSYLPNLAGWFVNISEQFDEWLKKKGQIGLREEIDQGIQSLKDLGGVLYETGGILAGLSRAATEAGGSTLGMLRETLKGIHDVVDSDGFQAGLVDVFNAAHVAMNNISGRAGPAVKQLFIELGELFTTILPLVGETIGTALSAIATALSQPAVTEGVKAVFTGLYQAVEALVPLMNPLGLALGAIMQVVAAMLPVFAGLVTTAFTPLADAVTMLAPALIPVVELLGGALTGIFAALAPLLMTVVQALVPLVEQLVSGLAPILATVVQVAGELIGAFQPVVTLFFELISAVLTPLMPMLAMLVSSLLPPLADAFKRVIAALTPFLAALVAIVDFIMPVLVPIITFLVGILVGSLISAINGVALILEGLKQIFVGVWEYIKGFFMVWIGMFKGIFTGEWDTLINGLKTMWNGVKTFLKGVWDTILGALIVWLSAGMLGAAKKGLAALKSLWNALWTQIKTLALSVWIALRTSWQGFVNQLRDIPQYALSYLRTLFKDTWTSIRTGATQAWTLVKSAFKTGVRDAVAFVKGLPGKAKTALASAGTALYGAGKDLINGFINGIKDMFGNVKSKLGELTSKLTEWKGPESLDRVLLVDAGRLVIDGFIKGLESRYSAVRKSLRGLTDDVGATQFNVPGAAVGGVSGGLASAVGLALSGSDGGGTTKVLNYYAAPGSSLGSEEDLFGAANRARFGW